ncbi:MAG: copper chaperone PCu(A)C [Bryobacteraceae bacterium]
MRQQSYSKRLTKAFLLMTVVLAPAFLSAQSAVTVQDAWARVPAPSKSDTAMFFVLENHTAQAKSVVAVSSTAAEKTEMHEMKMTESKAGMPGMPGMEKQQMMRMSPVEKIAIPANGKATLAPGGLHIMLFGLKSKVAEGDKIAVTLKLDDGTTIPVNATFRK